MSTDAKLPAAALPETRPRDLPETRARDLPETRPRDLPETRPRDLPETRPRAMHDMGGVSKFMCDAVDVEPHALNDFDREVDAIRGLLGAGKVMSVDELRRGIEAIPEADYLRLSYYQRWIRSIADNMLTKGVFTEAELAAALEDAR